MDSWQDAYEQFHISRTNKFSNNSLRLPLWPQWTTAAVGYADKYR